MLFIPGGMLHAIGEGCLILEIQQNSNTTYRVHDWGRTGRELHLDEAEAVIDWNRTESPLCEIALIEETPKYARWKMVACPYFKMEKWVIREEIPWMQSEDQFEILFFLSGKGSLEYGESHEIATGTSCLLPAACEPLLVEVHSPVTLFRITT